MIIDFIDIHKIFLFLGTLEGELVKKVFELILFLLITYMVISEYSRDQRRDLKYLIAGFSALSFEKIVSTIVLAGVLFGKLGATTYNSYFPVIDHLLETLALVLMVNAFLFPIIIKKIKSAKKVKLNLQEFELHSFCADNPSISLAKQKGIKIINNIPKDAKIKVDPDKFKQVLINILSNAVKYTDKDGKITISINSINNFWEIIISDTGVGISKKELEKIFDKFYQVEHHITRKEGGSGLGLTIAYEIIKLHKGVTR